MTANDIIAKLYFNKTTKKAYVIDDADYSALNVQVANLKCFSQLNNPLGNLVYQVLGPGSFIDLAASATESALYNIPAGSDGKILVGTYTFLYQVSAQYILAAVPITAFAAPSAGVYQILVNSADYSWMTAGDQFTVTGATTPGNNQTYTVVSVLVSGGASTITVQEAVTVEVGGSAVLAANITKLYSKTEAFDYQGCTEKTPVLNMTNDCFSTQFGTLTASDGTNWSVQTIDNRRIRIYYPEGLVDPVPPAEYEETTANDILSLTVHQLAEYATWTAILYITASYEQEDGLNVVYSLEYPKEAYVLCSGACCDLNDCILEAYENYTNNCTPGNTVMDTQAIRIAFCMAAYERARTCGNRTLMATWRTNLIAALNCDCCNELADQGPQWVNNGEMSATTTIDTLVSFMELYEGLAIGDLVYELTGHALAADVTAEGLDAIVVDNKYLNADSADHKHGIFIRLRGQGTTGGSGVTIRTALGTGGFPVATILNLGGATGYFGAEVSIVKAATANRAIVKVGIELAGLPTAETETEIDYDWNNSPTYVVTISSAPDAATLTEFTIVGYCENVVE